MLRVLAAVYMCKSLTHAGWHKAGPRGGPVSSHVFRQHRRGLFFLPSEVHGASGVIAAIISVAYTHPSQVAKSHGRNLDDMGPSTECEDDFCF